MFYINYSRYKNGDLSNILTLMISVMFLVGGKIWKKLVKYYYVLWFYS